MLPNVAPALQEHRLPQNAAARAAKDATYHNGCCVLCILQTLELELSMLDKKWQKKYDDRERDFNQIRARMEKNHEKDIEVVKEEMSQEVGGDTHTSANVLQPSPHA